MDYRQTLDAAKKRLEELVSQRDTIEREIQALLRIIEGAQFGSEPAEPITVPDPSPNSDVEAPGFTKTVRLILASSRTPLYPTEIRSALETLGIAASSPKILLIHTHNVLRRLLENGEIEPIPRDGKMAYRSLTAGDELARAIRQHPLVAAFSAFRTPKSETPNHDSRMHNNEDPTALSSTVFSAATTVDIKKK